MSNPRTLSELIEQAVLKHQTSVRQLGFMAQDRGFKVVGTTLRAIRAGSYKSQPSAETLRAIAWLAGVSESAAFEAAGQRVPGPPLADELPPGADNLSPKSRKAVIDMIRVLVDTEARADGSASDYPQETSNAGSVRQKQKAQLGDKKLTDAQVKKELQARDLEEYGGGFQ